MRIDLLLGVFFESLLANVNHLVLGQTQSLSNAGARFKGWIGALGLPVVITKEEDCIVYILGHFHFYD